MQVETVVDMSVAAKAVLRNGELMLDVSVAAPYGQRSASVSTHVVDAEALATVKAAIAGAIEATVKKLAPRAQLAALDAARIAGYKGEEVR